IVNPDSSKVFRVGNGVILCIISHLFSTSMRWKVFLAAAAAFAAVFLVIRFSSRKPLSLSALPTADKAVSEQQSQPKRSAVKATRAEQDAKASRLPLSQDLLWQKIPNEPVFAAFADWVNRYTTAPTAEAKKALEAEGIGLAGRRL